MLQGISERSNPDEVLCGDLTTRFDFYRHEFAGFFQNEVHFMPCAIAPKMQLAVLCIEGTPSVQSLKQSLLQPKTGIQALSGFCRRLDNQLTRRQDHNLSRATSGP